MSTEPSPTADTTRTNHAGTTGGIATTDIEARGRGDPWAAPDNPGRGTVTDGAPRQFEPGRRDRLANLIDDENAYCG